MKVGVEVVEVVEVGVSMKVTEAMPLSMVVVVGLAVGLAVSMAATAAAPTEAFLK